MKKETKLKILSYILWLHLFNFFGGYVVMAYLLKVEPGGTVHKWFVALWMLIGIALVVTTLSVANKANGKVKADVFFLGVLSADAWNEAFVSSIESYGYREIHSDRDDIDYAFSLYAQEPSQNPLSCIVIVKTHELNESIIDRANDEITDPLRTYLNCKTIRTGVNMISVFCVDKVSSAFYGLVNRHMAQELKNGRLVAGISFGGNRLYLGNFGEGYGKSKYLKLREQFIAMAGLEGKEPIPKD